MSVVEHIAIRLAFGEKENALSFSSDTLTERYPGRYGSNELQFVGECSRMRIKYHFERHI